VCHRRFPQSLSATSWSAQTATYRLRQAAILGLVSVFSERQNLAGEIEFENTVRTRAGKKPKYLTKPLSFQVPVNYASKPGTESNRVWLPKTG
jgi:hypothetical protein